MSKLRSGLKAALDKARTWLSEARAKAVQATLGTIATLAVTVGWLTDEQSTLVLGVTGSAIALVQGVLSLTRLTPSDASRWLGTAGRGLIYGLAAAAGAAGVGFGLWGDGDVTQWLGILSAGLTVVSTALSIANVQTVDAPRNVPDVDVSQLTRSEYQDIVDGQ
jgi:hypothetical protein